MYPEDPTPGATTQVHPTVTSLTLGDRLRCIETSIEDLSSSPIILYLSGNAAILLWRFKVLSVYQPLTGSDALNP
jgi:hypothetical protein